MKSRTAVIILGLNFLVVFTCFNGGNTLMSFIFDSYGFVGLGQTNGFFIYFGLFCSTFLVRRMLRCFSELKYAIGTGAFFYTPFLANGLLISLCVERGQKDGFCGPTLLRLVNYLCSFCLGFLGATILWTGQYQFIDGAANKLQKKQYFSLFFLFFNVNTILGNAFNYLFFWRKLETTLYFALFSGAILSASISFMLTLPAKRFVEVSPVEEAGTLIEMPTATITVNEQENAKQTVNQTEAMTETTEEPQETGNRDSSIVYGLRKFWATATLPKMRKVYPFMCQAGLFGGIVSGSLYHIVVQNSPEASMDDINMEISLMMIVYGLSATASTRRINRLPKHRLTLFLRFISLAFAFLAIPVVLLPQLIPSMPVTYLMAVVFGFFDASNGIVMSTYIAENFPKNMEAFTTRLQFSNIFTSSYLIASVLLPKAVFTYGICGLNLLLGLLQFYNFM